MNEIHVHNVPRKEYTVQVVYAGLDNEGPSWEEPDVWNIVLEASCSATALQDAVKIIATERAIIMTDYMTAENVMNNKIHYTYEEIEEIRQKASDDGVFQSWLMIEPSSMQVCLTEDLDTLRDLTAQSVTHSLEHVADEVEDFLKKGTTNDDA